MHLGIDGLVIRPRNAGSLSYFTQLLAAMAAAGDLHTWEVFANRGLLADSVFPQVKHFRYHPVSSTRIPAALQQQSYTGWGKLDVLHSVAFAPPWRVRGRRVMTVFDLTFLRFPATQKWTGRLWWNLFLPSGIRRADHLVAISESTRRDLIDLLGIAEERISVIYPYISDHFRPVEVVEPVLAHYHLTRPYIFYVGTLEPRKNIPTLLRAYARLRRTTHLPHTLVLAGQPGWLYADIYEVVKREGIEGQVIFLGYVPDVHLPALYSAADLFAYISAYEGFGIPVLEAMACGLPVLTSNASSLPEAAGDAGMLTLANDHEAVAQAMQNILEQRDRHAQMARRGLEWVKYFSQERFAGEMLSVYQRFS